MNTILDILNIHRYKNGRSEIDYFSRKLRPRHTLIEIDGKFYDRDTLYKRIVDTASNIVPMNLRALTAKERKNAKNINPWGIFGKVKTLPKNVK